MFFEHAKDARLYANLETMRTHWQHIVKPCIKYICPPKEYFGEDHCTGFAVVLTNKKGR